MSEGYKRQAGVRGGGCATHTGISLSRPASIKARSVRDLVISIAFSAAAAMKARRFERQHMQVEEIHVRPITFTE